MFYIELKLNNLFFNIDSISGVGAERFVLYFSHVDKMIGNHVHIIILENKIRH